MHEGTPQIVRWWQRGCLTIGLRRRGGAPLTHSVGHISWTGMAKLKRPNIQALLRRHPLWAFDDYLMSEIEDRVGATLFSYRAMTAARTQFLSNPLWFDAKDSRRGNKDRFKMQGGVGYQFRRFIWETTLSSLANAIEAVEISIRKATAAKFEIWKPGKFRSAHTNTAKRVLCLNNVIKHNRGLLNKRTSQHAKFLVEKCGMIDGYEIYLFDFDFEAIIRGIFFYLHDRASTTCSAPRTPRWAVESLYRRILPDFLPFCAPGRRGRKMPNRPLELTAAASNQHSRPTVAAAQRKR